MGCLDVATGSNLLRDFGVDLHGRVRGLGMGLQKQVRGLGVGLCG